MACRNRGGPPLQRGARSGDAPKAAPQKSGDIVAPVKQRRSAAMEFFGGLDVSIDQTAVCVVDDKGPVHLQTSVATDAGAIMKALKPFLPRLRRVGHEAGSLSPWLHPELTALGLPAACLETRHVHAAMSAQRNKTDATDALGIAHIVRTSWFKAAFIKSEICYRMRLLLTQRRNLKRKFLDIENTIRHSLKAFGVRLKGTSRGEFEQAVRAAVANDPLTRELMEAMLTARAVLWKQYCKLHDLVVKFVSRSELCRRFMAIPGVGPVTALSFMTAIDDPSRFRRSRDVAAYFGLTSRRHQSGTSIDVQGRISKAGDPEMRRALFEAAGVMLTRFKGKDKLKAWGSMLAKRGCRRKATVAVARKMAVVMHAMWRDGAAYVGDATTREEDVAARAAVKNRKLLGAHA
jgi:transposase